MVEKARQKKVFSGCGLTVLYYGFLRRRRAVPPSRTASFESTPEDAPASSPAPGRADPKRRPSGDGNSGLVLSPDAPRAPAARSTVPNARSRMPPPQRSKRAPSAPRLKSLPSISGELESFICDHRRAAFSNVMLLGNLGNLQGAGPSPLSGKVNSLLPSASKEMAATTEHGNTQRRRGGGGAEGATEGNSKAIELASTFSRRLSPEELNDMGNEEYKMGRYQEALELYDRAIALNPGAASYWSNKAAALIGLGRFLEAVAMCREAVRIDPVSCRAHHRLANLYRRLGIAEKALHYLRAAGKEASSGDFTQAQTLQTHLAKSLEARKLRDWQGLLKAAQSAVTSGADSAPQVFASQAEALLRLQRHDEANDIFIDAPVFDVDESTRFFGPAANAYFLSVRAEVDMAVGRFDEAVSVAQKAVLIDPSNKYVAAVTRRMRAVAFSRFRGNELFKASRFLEASAAYGEGLGHDPNNSILLCNRAASLSKLGEWERALEDCNSALEVRPSYNKARLRRADCYAKLEQWEASISDYEALAEEMSGDEEVDNALLNVRSRLKMERKGKKEGLKRGEKDEAMAYSENVIIVKTSEEFNHIIMAPGTCVAYFCNRADDSKQIWLHVEQLCRRYPSVNFLKVDEEDIPYLVESEGVAAVPSFKIYNNGSKFKELAGSNHDLLDSALRVFGI